MWKLALAIAALYDLEVEQYNVETAFLNSDADSDIYVKLPPEWKENSEILSDEYYVKLLKALYGLKQSPRLWQEKLRIEFAKIGYESL